MTSESGQAKPHTPRYCHAQSHFAAAGEDHTPSVSNKVNKACPAYPEELSEVNKDVMAVPGKT